jgi:ATP-dependent DNA helicase RecG
LLLPFGIACEVLVGSQGVRSRRSALERLGSGEAALAVGTHALLTDGVEFAKLGLAAIDEQHRFGVAQRAQLRAKSAAPHTLYLTATPIPRTLAQTLYADLDLSIIDELPPGRSPVKTYVRPSAAKAKVYEFVRDHVARGRQAYVVAPAIDESESALTSAVTEAQALQTSAFAGLRVGVLHGKLPPREKEAIMSAFARGEVDVLIATTVVEVGVDVSNASVMVVLDADHFGLAQLHQLRGRVGRGAAQSYCILVADSDAERLGVLAATSDGFRIAEEDLRLRPRFEFAGTLQAGSVQSGATAMLLEKLMSDFSLYMRAKEAAQALLQSDPALARPEHASLRAVIAQTDGTRAILVTS